MNDIHIIRDKDVNVLFHIPSSSFFKVSDDLIKTIDESANIELEDNPKIRSLLELLKQQKPLISNPPIKQMRLNKLTFLSTHDCNLRCRYCFAKHGTYNSNKGLHMPLSVYKEGLDFLLSKYSQGIERIMFFGGEPLLGFNQIKEFIPYCLSEIENRKLDPPILGIVTNGTVLNESMIEFFNQVKGFSMTISIDGSKGVNDKVRKSPGDWSVYDKIRDNVRLLNNKRSFSLHAEVTLSKQHLLEYYPGKAREWLSDIFNMGFDGIVMGVACTNDEYLNFSDEDKIKYKQMYSEMIDFLMDAICDGKNVLSADIVRLLQTLNSDCLKSMACSAGVNNLSITADGYILPCYLLYDSGEFYMGNVQDKNFDKFDKILEEFKDHYYNKPKECQQCWIKNICTVMCRGFNYTLNQDMFSILPSRCWTMESLVESVLINMTKIRQDPQKYKVFLNTIERLKNMYHS